MNMNISATTSLLIPLFFGVTCNKSSFTGNTNKKQDQTNKNIEQIEVETNKEDPVEQIEQLDSFEKVEMKKPLEPKMRYRERIFWIATQSNKAYYFKLKDMESDDDIPTVETQKTWSFSADTSCGTRTFVTEGGFLFSRCGPEVFYISKETPENQAITAGFKGENFNGGARSCVVSYKKRDGKRYAGVGWTDMTTQHRKFAEFKMSDKAPYDVDLKNPTKIVTLGATQAHDHCTGPGGWGYSCYVDQRNFIYYGACHNTPSAIDLNTLESMDAKISAKNATFVSTNLENNFVNATSIPSESWDPNIHTYAIGGDNLGNLLQGIGRYAYTFEPRSKTIWNTAHWTTGEVGVFPQDCFFEKETCENFKMHPSSELGATMGCASSLGDGYIITSPRTSDTVYALRLADYKDPASDIKKYEIAKVTGAIYMYNDFTGATLYETAMTIPLDFSKQDNFDSQKITKKLSFEWENKPGTTSQWTEASVAVRCYAKDINESDLPEAEDIGEINDAGDKTYFMVASCEKDYEIVEVNVTPAQGSNMLFEVEAIDIIAYQ